MPYRKEYTAIYIAYNVHGHLNLLFYNSDDKTALFFDGLDFYYKVHCHSIPPVFEELTYSLQSSPKLFTVESIRESWSALDQVFIKLINGDIFYIHPWPDGDLYCLQIFQLEKHRQINTPNAISSYDAMLKQLNKSDECEVIINGEPIPDIIPYLPPPLPDKPYLRFIRFVSRVLRSLRYSTLH